MKDKPDTVNFMTEKPGGTSGNLKSTAEKKNGMSKLGNDRKNPSEKGQQLGLRARRAGRAAQ